MRTPLRSVGPSYLSLRLRPLTQLPSTHVMWILHFETKVATTVHTPLPANLRIIILLLIRICLRARFEKTLRLSSIGTEYEKGTTQFKFFQPIYCPGSTDIPRGQPTPPCNYMTLRSSCAGL